MPSRTQLKMVDNSFNFAATIEEDEVIAKGGVACPFPWRLHEMLKVAAKEGMEDIVSWAPHGRAFTVHKPKEFEECLMKRYVELCIDGMVGMISCTQLNKGCFRYFVGSFPNQNILHSNVS